MDWQSSRVVWGLQDVYTHGLPPASTAFVEAFLQMLQAADVRTEASAVPRDATRPTPYGANLIYVTTTMSNSHGVAANERLSSLTRTYRHSTSLGMQHARRPIFETTTLQRIDEDGSVYVLRFYRETREGDAPEVLSYRPYVAGETDFSNEVQLTDDTRTLLAA